MCYKTNGSFIFLTKSIFVFLTCLLVIGCQHTKVTHANSDAPNIIAHSSTRNTSPTPVALLVTPPVTDNTDALNTPFAETHIGAAQLPKYLPLLKNKRVGLIVNQTSMLPPNHAGVRLHLVDALLEKGIHVQKVFAPEHGFRGNKGAGEKITDNIDTATGLPILSLYGKTKKPTPKMLEDIDILVFDIQDVGVRFYTYISTMHYAMEAAAENNIPFMVLDRPNPNGRFIAGPVLEREVQSFVGMHPIPVQHGLTVGELALMIKGEQWIAQAEALQLKVIPMQQYHKDMVYSLPVAPSPNLPNDNAIRMYASLCLLEPTTVSIGRGTDYPFQMLGHPGLSDYLPELAKQDKLDNITPISLPESAPSPKWQDIDIPALTLTQTKMVNTLEGFNLTWVYQIYHAMTAQEKAFITSESFFDKLAGTKRLREQLEAGVPLAEIEQSWEADLQTYKKIINPYLLYPAASD